MSERSNLLMSARLSEGKDVICEWIIHGFPDSHLFFFGLMPHLFQKGLEVLGAWV